MCLLAAYFCGERGQAVRCWSDHGVGKEALGKSMNVCSWLAVRRRLDELLLGLGTKTAGSAFAHAFVEQPLKEYAIPGQPLAHNSLLQISLRAQRTPPAVILPTLQRTLLRAAYSSFQKLHNLVPCVQQPDLGVCLIGTFFFLSSARRSLTCHIGMRSCET